MKKNIIISVLLLACAGIHAQGLTLSLDITAGGLKDAMTPEQKKAVTNLTLTGSMNDSDFYLIRDSMSKLEELNLKEADVKMIPKKGLAYPSNLLFLTLPRNLESIEDSAFYYLNDITFTGSFPKIGKNIFHSAPKYYVSSDNVYCKEIDGCIYSPDKRILYLASNWFELEVLDDVERIGRYAFNGCTSYSQQFVLYESINYIETGAFRNLRAAAIALNNGGYEMVDFYCNKTIPPTLEENVFTKENVGESTLYVPSGYVELYESLPQWREFGKITSIGGSSINNEVESSVTIKNDQNGISLIGSLSIKKIVLISITGERLFSLEDIDLERVFIDSKNLDNHLILFILSYENGEKETFKLNVR